MGIPIKNIIKNDVFTLTECTDGLYLWDNNYKICSQNVLHKTSKGMREMNYQDTQLFERATMLNNLMKPLLVLCGVTARFYLSYYQRIRK